jgi:sugar phosphate isomerase/epimerase
LKLAISNEIFKNWELENVISFCAESGYDGIEIAAPSLAEKPDQLAIKRRESLRNFAENHKIDIIGLNRILLQPEGLSISSPHEKVRIHTQNYLTDLIDLCADLGGQRLIFDSPKQRNMAPTQNFHEVWGFVCTLFSNLMQKAAERNVSICFEALSPSETNFLNTVTETLELILQVNHPNFLLNLNFKAMREEEYTIAEIIGDAKNYIGHIHLNESIVVDPENGIAELPIILDTLRQVGYHDYLTLESSETTSSAEQIATTVYSHLSKLI